MSNEDTAARNALVAEYNALPTLLLASGQKWTTGELFPGVANTDTKRLVLENDYSDRALLTLEPTVNCSGQFFTEKRKNVTVGTAGNAAAIFNPKTDVTTSPSVRATTAGDGETGAVSGGTQYPQVTAGSGSNKANASPGESGTTGITDVIMPGDSLTVGAQNQSGSTQDISIVVSFLVFDTDELDALRF